MIKFNKIFGIGVDRTGTTSLTEALNSFGIKTIHRPQYLAGVLEAERRLKAKPLSTHPEYRGFTDNPIPNIYEDLDREYPGSKFIVTVRDFDSWFQSKKNLFIWQRKMFERKIIDKLEFNEDEFRRNFDAHYEKVFDYFKNRDGDYLVLNIGDGNEWRQLCGFLDVPIPTIPFPHKNVTKGMK